MPGTEPYTYLFGPPDASLESKCIFPGSRSPGWPSKRGAAVVGPVRQSVDLPKAYHPGGINYVWPVDVKPRPS